VHEGVEHVDMLEIRIHQSVGEFVRRKPNPAMKIAPDKGVRGLKRLPRKQRLRIFGVSSRPIG